MNAHRISAFGRIRRRNRVAPRGGDAVFRYEGSVRAGATGAAACASRQTDMEKALAAKFAPESVAGVKVPVTQIPLAWLDRV